MATSPTPPREPTPPRPSSSNRRLLLWIALAFVAGLVLFALAMRGSGKRDFYRAGEVPPSTAEPVYAPLPAPTAGADGSGIGPLAPPAPEDIAAAPETPRVAAPAPVARPTPPPRPAVADRKPRPIPGQTPAPEYPYRALRNGEGGTVLVLVRIGPDGVPTSTDVAQSSGSRELDRAATQAVRRWRFEPAISDGHPSVGEAVVPIDFKLSE